MDQTNRSNQGGSTTSSEKTALVIAVVTLKRIRDHAQRAVDLAGDDSAAEYDIRLCDDALREIGELDSLLVMSTTI